MSTQASAEAVDPAVLIVEKLVNARSGESPLEVSTESSRAADQSIAVAIMLL